MRATPSDVLSGKVGPPGAILALGVVKGRVEDWVLDVGRPSVEPSTALLAAVDDQDLRRMNGEMLWRSSRFCWRKSWNLLVGVCGQVNLSFNNCRVAKSSVPQTSVERVFRVKGRDVSSIVSLWFLGNTFQGEGEQFVLV
jgi:hypothetical protein